MGYYVPDQAGYDSEGHPKSSARAEVAVDTVHPQGKTKADIERDYVGSSTVSPNVPGPGQKIVPVGATVADGVIEI